MKTTRLEFVQGTMGVCAFGLLTAACGDDDDDTPGGTAGAGGEQNPDGNTGGVDGNTGGTGSSGVLCGSTIASNHGHKLTVTSAEAAAGVAKTYDIQGSATHNHTVSISADDFAALLDGTSVMIASSTDASHQHEVTIDCT